MAKISFWLFILALFICSCAQKKNLGATYKIFKKEQFREFTFLHGKKDTDTLLFIARTDSLLMCGKKIKRLDTLGMKKISSLPSKHDTIVFCYKAAKSISCILYGKWISACAGRPDDPTKTYLDYYYSFPYYFNCKDL